MANSIGNIDLSLADRRAVADFLCRLKSFLGDVVDHLAGPAMAAAAAVTGRITDFRKLEG